ncbi:MAG: tol-pal system YbgF family protein [Bacteroidales bacterium]
MRHYNNLVDKYIYGELDISEMEQFEQTMDSDTNLKKEYLLYADINKAIHEEDVMMLRGSLNTIYDEMHSTKIIPLKIPKRRIYYAAASIALLIATGSIVYEYSKPNLNNDAIYTKYFTPYEVSVTYRSGNEEIDRVLISALEKYENKDYENAVKLFEKVLEKRSTDIAANLYTGIALMETEKYQKATKSFQTIITHNNNLFIEQAKWYLAMCYIKTGQVKKAEITLNELVINDSYYKKPAKKVLNDLK